MRIVRSLAQASLKRSTRLAAAAALLFASASAVAQPLNFRGETINVNGVGENFTYVKGDPGSGTEELILVWTNAAPNAGNTITLPSDGIEAQVLLVGGGGAGGYGTTGTSNPGGGGGGGQVRDVSNLSFKNGVYAITVGGGGAQTTAQGNGANGAPSILSKGSTEVAKALGGGGGGAKGDGNGGNDVASGGGGGGSGNGGVGVISSGGKATTTKYSGGGGGAGGFGQDSDDTKGGDGGAGVGSTIWADVDATALSAIPRRYGGGGGGGQSSDRQAEHAGAGADGGGRGGYQGVPGEDGKPCTGGGGGGGGRASAGKNGGAGGSGLVIIRLTSKKAEGHWQEISILSGAAKIYADGGALVEKEGNDVIITYTETSYRGGLCFYDPTKPDQPHPPIGAEARILAVGGGGGGGMVSTCAAGGGAGGGAGGFVEAKLVFDSSVQYSIQVGAGGAGGQVDGESGASGEASLISANGNLVEALGGGGGGARAKGRDGGSGGGGSRSASEDETGSFGRAGGRGLQGFAGGDAFMGLSVGAGGGGAGGKGGDTLKVGEDGVPGDGGAGRESDITGKVRVYAAGGGGAYVSISAASGSGEGGKGGSEIGGNGAGVTTNGVVQAATSGEQKTGSGGGGGVAFEGASQPAGAGGSGVVIIRLSNFLVGDVKVPEPQGPFTYNGNAQTGVVEHLAYRLSGEPVATDAGIHEATATIPEGAPWSWADGGGRGPKTLRWEILTATNEITELSLKNWREGETASKPVCHWMWEHIVPNDPVTYQWRKKGETEWADELKPVDQLVLPTENGNYELRAYVCADSHHATPNWVAAEKIVAFSVELHPAFVFTDYVDITVSGYSGGGETLTDFPVLVRLKEPVDGPRSGLPGFSYARVDDRSAIRFVQLANAADYNKRDDERADKSADVVLVHEVEVWNPKGESLVWVKVPKLSGTATKFRMYWHLRPGRSVPAPVQASGTWSDYVGVWHLNEEDTVAPVEHSRSTTPNATDTPTIDGHLSIPSKLDDGILGRSVWVNDGRDAKDIRGGVFVRDTGDHSPLDLGSKFSISGWFKHDENIPYNWDHIFYKREESGSGFIWGSGKDPAEMKGFAIEVEGQDTDGRLSNILGAGTDLTIPKSNDDALGHWVYRTYVFNDTKCTVYENGIALNYAERDWVPKNTIHPVLDNNKALTFGNCCLIAESDSKEDGTGGNCPWYGWIDEVRLSSAVRSATWVRAEYETVTKADFCTFGLVSQMQDDGETAWINWWTEEPTLTRYWDKDTLTREAVDAAGGALRSGAPTTYSFTKMPEREPVDFPDPNEFHAYLVTFTMVSQDYWPADPWKGRHVLFGGACVRDLEIVDHDPRPIDPDGPEGATLSGRVLTANDDDYKTRAVALQSYWRTDDFGEALNPHWHHTGGALDSGMNLRPGISHALRVVTEGGAKTNDLWNLYDVYIGNMMTNDATAAESSWLSSRWNTLPWPRGSSKPISAPGAKFNFTEVGQLVMRNVGGDSSGGGAEIRSGVFTDGVGTVYFDVVNAYAGADVNPEHYKLVVEYDDPDKGDGSEGNWRKVEMSVLDVSGSSLSLKVAATNELSCLDVQNGGNENYARFCRVFAKLDRREPTRIRIRRTSARVDEGGLSTGADDPDGFIVLDNVIVSWPAPVPRIVPTGRYDATRHAAGAPVLGVEGAFSADYPSVGDTFYVNAHLEGGTAGQVATARCHYRWRYADTEFVPSQEGGHDAWDVSYLSLTNETFSTAQPLAVGDLPGDVEFKFDLTALVPYYEYTDYTGIGLSKATAKYSHEEPNQNVPSQAKPEEYLHLPDGFFPSHGTNWFVRLREWANPNRGWWLFYKTSEGAEPVRLAFELTDAREWRACLPTKVPLEKLYVRLESERADGRDAAGIHLVTNRWAVESADALPKRLTLTSVESEGWGTVPCDAKSGCLVFIVDEAKQSVMVSHADRQDFNLWTSGVNVDGLFSGSSVDTNSTSSAACEAEADILSWRKSAATNTAWSVDFSVGGGVVASKVYPRNEPFSEWSVNSWMAENAMWTYGKWSLRNKENEAESFGDETALQIEGRGKGRFSFVDGLNTPDGLDTITYKAHVAQYNEFENFTYFNTSESDRMSIDMTNYTFATCAALTAAPGGAALYDGDGSVSLVAHYRPEQGCYEFRVSRGWDDKRIRLALYRWRVSGGAMICEKLMNWDRSKNYNDFWEDEDSDPKHEVINIKRLIKESLTPLGGLFVSVKEENGATVVVAGVRRADVSVSMGMESQDRGQSYACVAYRDTTSDRLRSGTFGVLACNCPGVFVKPVYWKNAVEIADFPTVDQANVLLSGTKNVTFTGNRDVTTCREYTNWTIKPGRTEKLVSSQKYFGFQAPAPQPQKVVVQISETGAGGWTGLYTNIVDKFTYETYKNVVHDSRKCLVRLQAVGQPDDVRTDVVIKKVDMTQWNGQWSENFEMSGVNFKTNVFAYTSAWITEDEMGRRVVKLQPTRARNASTPVSLRSSALRGLGLVHFRWSSAERHAKVRVQYKELATINTIGNATTTLTSGPTEVGNGWVDLETIPVGEEPNGGSRTVLINRRYNGKVGGRDYYFGLIRIVIDAEVEAEAVQRRRTDPEYGAVEICEAYAWDLPEYDERSWSGWNFRTAGWNGSSDPDSFANLTDGLRGLSAILNNTLDESTLADREKSHYDQRMPGVQSPTFLTNCIGAVSFRARLYGPNDLIDRGSPAVVTVLGTSVLDDRGEPVDGTWVDAGDAVISNRVYGLHTVRLSPTQNFKAIRLVVKGVEDVREELSYPEGKRRPKPVYDPPLRVAIDDVVIWERQSQSLAFRKLHVRPFRDSVAIRGTEVVQDIADMAEQPLIGEAFGFQAEVEVVDPEEVLVGDPEHPITVDLWYYPGSDVWGFENWKTNAGVIRVAGLLPATDGNGLVFRSTLDQSASLCPPQFLEEGEGYKIVQYHMVAHYYDSGRVLSSHDLLPDEWTMPSWNTGFPDPNARGTGFSAFTLLEEIAPGRAWINEINYCEPNLNASRASQWIELAVPSGVDMTGWTVTAYDFTGAKVAELAALGLRGSPASKTYRGSNEIALASHYAFYTIKGPNTVLADADAIWPAFGNTGILDYTYPYAFELKRPTGVVEHRVVAQGYNQYKGKKSWWTDYEGTNLVEVMHRKQGGEWTWSAEDSHDAAFANCGVSVVTNQGALHADWASPVAVTPGEINKGQWIDPHWFILPNGGYVKIYSAVVGEHMRQIIAGVTNTIDSITISQGNSTNIDFEVDRWYKLGDCKITPDERTSLSGPRLDPASGKTYYRLNMNMVSNSIDVTVSASVADTVAEMLDPKYPEYTPAVMKWLEKGVTGGADGGAHPFKNPNGPIRPMHYRGVKGLENDEMKLPDMYWLDVDPTDGNWELWGGMGDRPGSPGTLGPVDEPVYRPRVLADGSVFIHTNHQTTVWLELRNAVEGLSYPPYRLQGLGNEQSDSDIYTGAWTSANFKVTMELQNGKVDNVFQPMRYFVFDRNSFRPKNDPVSPYAARVEITDPFSDQSPASEWGWKPYWHCPVFTSWALDGRVTPNGVSTLKSNDILEF